MKVAAVLFIVLAVIAGCASMKRGRPSSSSPSSLSLLKQQQQQHQEDHVAKASLHGQKQVQQALETSDDVPISLKPSLTPPAAEAAASAAEHDGVINREEPSPNSYPKIIYRRPRAPSVESIGSISASGSKKKKVSISELSSLAYTRPNTLSFPPHMQSSTESSSFAPFYVSSTMKRTGSVASSIGGKSVESVESTMCPCGQRLFEKVDGICSECAADVEGMLKSHGRTGSTESLNGRSIASIGSVSSGDRAKCPCGNPLNDKADGICGNCAEFVGDITRDD